MQSGLFSVGAHNHGHGIPTDETLDPALYFAVALYYAWIMGLYLGLPFLLLFHAGFLYTGLLSSGQSWLHQFKTRQPSPSISP